MSAVVLQNLGGSKALITASLTLSLPRSLRRAYLSLAIDPAVRIAC